MTEDQIKNVVLEFMKGWLDWAENDDYSGFKFSPGFGLCANFEIYIDEEHQGVSEDTTDRLLEVFGEIIGEDAYPFGGVDTYVGEKARNTMHKNPERLHFARSTILHLGG